MGKTGVKGWRAGLERVFDWSQDYGWSIPLFGLGFLFGAALISGTGWLESTTAIGTLAAAIAAFWSVNFSRGVQRKRDEQEDRARKPSLQITHVESPPAKDPPVYIFKFVNLSQQSIYIKDMYQLGHDAVDPDKPRYLYHVDTIVRPYEVTEYCSLDLVGTFHIRDVGSYKLLFYFNYAMTGPLSYRLAIPMRIRKVEQREPKLKAVVFEFRGQQIEGPLEPPPGAKAIHMFIADQD